MFPEESIPLSPLFTSAGGVDAGAISMCMLGFVANTVNISSPVSTFSRAPNLFLISIIESILESKVLIPWETTSELVRAEPYIILLTPLSLNSSTVSPKTSAVATAERSVQDIAPGSFTVVDASPIFSTPPTTVGLFDTSDELTVKASKCAELAEVAALAASEAAELADALALAASEAAELADALAALALRVASADAVDSADA